MAVITKLIVEQAARSITCFLMNVTPETKKGNHPILLTGGVDVEVELKAGLEDKVIVIAKVANCVVYRDKVTAEQLWDIKQNTENLYSTLLFRILESLYDNTLIGDFSLMKLISAVSNRHITAVSLNLPGGYVVDLNADSILIKDYEGKPVELREFSVGDFPLSPALCIPKTIVAHMVFNDFKPFVI